MKERNLGAEHGFILRRGYARVAQRAPPQFGPPRPICVVGFDKAVRAKRGQGQALIRGKDHAIQMRTQQSCAIAQPAQVLQWDPVRDARGFGPSANGQAVA